MKTLKYVLYKFLFKSDNEAIFIKCILTEILCSISYSMIVFYDILHLQPIYYLWFCNAVYLVLIYWKYYDRSLPLTLIWNGFRTDTLITNVFQCIAYCLYPYVVQYHVWWRLLLSIIFIGRVLSMKKSYWNAIMFGLEILRKMEKSEEIQEMESETKQPTVPLKSKREELKQSHIEESQKLKQWEDRFEKWSSSKAKEMANLVSEEARVEAEMNSCSTQMVRVMEEIAKLNIEHENLAKKKAELESKKNKLTDKRHKIETQADERIFQQKAEKANILNKIKNIKIKLNLVHDDNETPDECDIDKTEHIATRIQQITKEIEEKERDLECPVCFDICARPIFMCHLSHQICKQCRPKVKVCPQCRQPFRKQMQRHKVKENTSNQLKILYKNMRELLEKS